MELMKGLCGGNPGPTLGLLQLRSAFNCVVDEHGLGSA